MKAVIDIIEALPKSGTIDVTSLAKKLNRAKSSISEALGRGIKYGWITNDESKPGVKAKLRRGLPYPIPKEDTNYGCALYFIGHGRLIKVGISKNPAKRLRTIMSCSGFSDMEIIALEWFESKEQARQEELRIHESWKEFNTVGEWFDMRLLQEYLNETSR